MDSIEDRIFIYIHTTIVTETCPSPAARDGIYRLEKGIDTTLNIFKKNKVSEICVGVS